MLLVLRLRPAAAALGCASLVLATIASGCEDDPGPGSTSTGGGGATGGADPGTRSFDLGFTPWPWDASVEAIDWTWTHIATDGDLVSQHVEEGVPWPEAATDAPFPSDFQSQLDERKARASGKKQLLALNPLDTSRTGLAGMRTDQRNAPLVPPWSDYALDDPAVKDAYLRYVRRMVDTFEPDFIQTGIEVNLLRRDTDAAKWAELVHLQCHVYQGLKELGYVQPISVSLVSTAFYHPEQYEPRTDASAQLAALHDLEPCVDVVSWSVYPYISGLFADSLPPDYFDTILGLTKKPQAISESGYPAQEWSIEGVGTWTGTPAKQAHFVEAMLESAHAHDLRFVVWFTIRDYDQLWSAPTSGGGLASDPTALVFRDTGLYDESGKPREAWNAWTKALALSHQ